MFILSLRPVTDGTGCTPLYVCICECNYLVWGPRNSRPERELITGVSLLLLNLEASITAYA